MDASSTGITILKSNIENNKAILEIENHWKGFNLNTLEEAVITKKAVVSLAKEEGGWKITEWRRFPAK